MPTIGIVGANGQVGTEVCLLLSLMPGCRVVPIVRNPIGSAFLRRLGLECRHGDVGSPEDGRRLLDGCDVAVDMSLPKGSASGIRAQIRRTVSGAVGGSQQGCRLVYVSTVMAFGMLDDRRFKRRFVARTVYGATKRFGERLATGLGRRQDHEVFVLRLGQVHGELQEVSRSIRNGLVSTPTMVPAGPSWTVFAYSVAEALANIGRGLERPGLYTLVSVPPWSWKEVYEYYCRMGGIEPAVFEDVAAGGRGGWSAGRPSMLLARLGAPAMRWAVAHREALAGHLLDHLPTLERRAFARYGLRRAGRSISALQDSEWHRPFEHVFLGEAPGRRLRSLSDSRVSMGRYTNELRSLLRRLWAGPAAPTGPATPLDRECDTGDGDRRPVHDQGAFELQR
jgi:nucleoside-diphosphate-sugar epimerase